MKKVHSTAVAILVICGVGLTSCAGPRANQQAEHYVSSQVEGEEQKINLEEVQKAFWETKGTDPKDFNSWMGAFEKRVNEIYEGDGVVSIDASRETGKLTVTGYLEDKKEQGFQPGEEKLFSIEQTGDVTSDNQLPYRVNDYNNRPYYEGHRSILDSPFVQMMVISHLMGGFGGRYYTPYPSIVVLRDQRNTFRTTPAYSTQKAANTTFKQTSKAKFGSASTTTTSKRGWGGFGKSSSSSSSSTRGFGWGGRRSSGFGMRGWGGRRR